MATIGGDGYPYITPVNYVFWRKAIYFHCALQGEKIDNILRRPRVCFEVDLPLAYLDCKFDRDMAACDVGQFYESVIIRGTAAIVESTYEKVGALNALLGCHENIEDFTVITEHTQAVTRCLVVVIRVESLSAKANLAHHKSTLHRKKICKYLEKRKWSGDEETVMRIRMKP